MTQQYVTLSDVEEAERLLRERNAEAVAELATRRQQLSTEAEEARRTAARGRLAVLNGDLIPANTARQQAAHERLGSLLRSDDDPLVVALREFLETNMAEHALTLEASSMEATAGLLGRPTLAAPEPDVFRLLLDELRVVAQERKPQPVALPSTQVKLSREDEMTAERLRQHHGQLLHIFLGLSAGEIAAVTPEEFPAKVAEAEAEQARRQALVSEGLRHDEITKRREPSAAFRTILGE